ncbi:NlpC/P60 family protein [Umezawaea sp. Da 62-37]|uniref:C40 family peptidase n=1 Tax=Umezawaea sp. Da 62-37 TaxID=3075927 RepID=UPI0028F7142F|nr:NlpC/P60 family protein [Umezawaea sp. Da 62-37]WNV86700.1 NlpC/P60 family protein [Umezawaea sp. Da 62-37]WNV86717.1 NlpC/P60 family protein [Umezawaea sp. Da 62-37]
MTILAFVTTMLGVSLVRANPAAAALPGCLAGEIVDVTATPSGNGYTLVGGDGGVFNFGDSRFQGSMGGKPLNKPMVAIASTASGAGYWEIAADGGVFAFGDAMPPADNPLPGMQLIAPVVDVARVGAQGLLLVAGDGGVFALGGARHYGSMAGRPLNAPMVDIVTSPTGNGYATIAADGGVFAFGDYQGPADNPVPGMAARGQLRQPITGAARHGSGFGLILVGGDGGTFALGGATFIGSAANLTLAKPISGIALDSAGTAQWLTGRDGGVFAYGPGNPFMGNAVSNGNCSSTPATTTGVKIVQYAKDIRDGKPVTPWQGGAVPYSWGGGHGTIAGPSAGTCIGYTGSAQPCPAERTKGVDCSGFTRWVYKLAYGTDVFGGVNTNGQLARMKKVTSPLPGDLVFFGASASNTTHVGVYIGNGRMIEAPNTGSDVKENPVSSHPKLVGYYRY